MRRRWKQSFAGYGPNADFVARLDKAVDEILGAGMAVEIDLHPEEPYKLAVRTQGDAVDKLVALWRKLAAHYANRDPERVFFEVMNEPEVMIPIAGRGFRRVWRRRFERLRRSIRSSPRGPTGATFRTCWLFTRCPMGT